jgi:hypothetical protein
MEDFQSKYTGEQIEEILDKATSEDGYVTKEYVTSVIEQSIYVALNTEV